MKRHSLAFALLVGLLATPHGARAHEAVHDFEGSALPCTVACPYWPPYWEACFPPDEKPAYRPFYFDTLTEVAPAPPVGRKMILRAEIKPAVDWDLFLCSYPGYREGKQGTDHILGEPCDNFLGPDNPVPIGCFETAQAPAESGKQYVLRLYNWSDPFPVRGAYRWIFV